MASGAPLVSLTGAGPEHRGFGNLSSVSTRWTSPHARLQQLRASSCTRLAKSCSPESDALHLQLQECASRRLPRTWLPRRLGRLGNVSWSKVYLDAPGGSAITQIKQSSDGGYIAVGNDTDATQNTGGLILKLDSAGNVQFQRQLGPTASTFAYPKAVQQTADGGYIVAGEFLILTPGTSPTNVLAVKLDATGNVHWQQGFADLSNAGVVASTEHALSVVPASDGGYVIGGNWTNSTFPAQCCAGALLVKLSSAGALQWQNAYSGGESCSYQSCSNITGIIYSVHQTSDGGYVVAGAFDPLTSDSIVPWLANVDSVATWCGSICITKSIHRPTCR
jgi:hypothetical protein